MRKSANRSLAKKKADRVFSLFIRRRDADHKGTVTCVTCGEVGHYKDMDAGHFISRDKIPTRYDEQNVHVQCRKCNRFRGGEQYKHGVYIEYRYGAGTAARLQQKSQGISKYDQSYFEAVASKYKERLDGRDSVHS